MTFKTLPQFMTAFPDNKKGEAAAKAYFEKIRFANGDFCPHCEAKKIHRFKDGRYRCYTCKRDFTIKTGTIFGESKIPLRTWFLAIFLLTTRKKGISSIELAQLCGVTQKTAWFMDHRIREALSQGNDKLFGTVEVDETYLGGRHNRKHGFSKKSVVMGMMERGGRVKAYSIPHRGTEAIIPNITGNVDWKAKVMSDEACVYKKLPRTGYQHSYVKHGKKRWTYKGTNTNSIESFWATLKRGYHGTYHHMSYKHMQRYVNEFSFRFNGRKEEMDALFALATMKIAESDRLTWKALTA